MNPLSSSMLVTAGAVAPAFAVASIALGTTAILSQPAAAAEQPINLDYHPDQYPTYDSTDFRRSESLQRVPGFHYAYYYIAQPEYIL